VWLDGDWPSSLHEELSRLWDLYGDAKEGRVSDSQYNLEKRFKLKDEIVKMRIDLRNA
jgi:hypothetical protein